ncbi:MULTISPECIES: ribosome silencing factor [Dermacoccus]|uniref:Ribosomal silencing factor RsfS n=3 Tax=Dermacoccus TaxID=57495 RepID=A0A417Z8Z1_9MICO|nr:MULTISPECIES: ribosome silencing factor [Dermacoccus]MBE7371119.1 ribosome silencing factor [Dermacoccus barathri]QEH93538.1 ribosome silencing factor [Dermacoccus abyssi]RHW47100.1 ribosome silencing factor [Dermacoccus abyssi]
MTATDRSIELTQAAAQAAADKLATSIVALDVSDQLAITDTFVIASAESERQVNAIVDAVEEALLPLGSKPVRREGRASGRWVLIDFGDIVLQAFHEEDREFYDLERLWQDCPVIELDLDEAAS